MSEVILDRDVIEHDERTPNVKGTREKIVQFGREELSPIDYKTQAVLSIFSVSLGDLYAGNYLAALGKFAITMFSLGAAFPVVQLSSFMRLSDGSYTDGNGKLIRQAVHLKKEEISSYDQKMALIFCFFLGWAGAHQFYAGKPLKGVLMLCSFGGFGIWNIINIYQLLTCGFKDGQGKTICADYIKIKAGTRV